MESTQSAAAGGLDGLPREDISGKITPTLLKGMESSDWKVGSLLFQNLLSDFFVLAVNVSNEWSSYIFLIYINCFFCFQVRLESIEAVNKILEDANKRIQPTGTGTVLSKIL